MPLDKQYREVPLGFGGIPKNRVDEKLIESPTLEGLTNGEITQQGSIVPRAGFQPLADTGIVIDDITFPIKLAKRGDSLVVLEKGQVAEYSATLDGWTGYDKSHNPIAAESWFMMTAPDYNVNWVDCCVNNNLLFVTYFTDSCYITVYDLSTRSIIRSDIIHASATQCKLANAGDRVYAVYRSTSAAALSISYIDSSSPSDIDNGWHTLGIKSSLLNQNMFDVHSDGTSMYLAAQSATAANFRLFKINENGAESYNRNNDGGAHDYVAMSVFKHDTDASVLVVMANTTNITFRVCDSTTGIQEDTSTLVVTDCKEIICFTYSATHFGVVIEEDLGGLGVEYNLILIYTVQISDGANTLVDSYFNLGLAHKAIGDHTDETCRFGLVKSDDYEAQIQTVEYHDDYGIIPAAVYSRKKAASEHTAYYNTVSGVGQDSDGNTYFAFRSMFKVQTTDGGFSSKIGISIGKYSEDNNKRNNYVEHDSSVVFSGGRLFMWDGAVSFPLGFNHAPVILTMTAESGAGGNLTPETTYQYIAIYEYTDIHGNIHRSKPSLTGTIALAAGEDGVALEVRLLADSFLLSHPGDQDNQYPKVILYRTEADGTVFHRLNSPASETTNFATNTYDETDILDRTGDSNMNEAELLYTTGGVLENDMPPPSDCVCIHKNRLFIIDTESGDVCHSKEFLPGEGIAFNDEFRIPTGDQDKRPLWLISMDENLVVFWEHQIGVIYGDGPNDLGQGGTFTLPRVITNQGIKANTQRAVIKTPVGILFESLDGMKKIDRGLQVSDMGIPNPVGYFTCAHLSESRHQVWFFEYTAAGTTGYAYVYDYLIDQWFFHTITLTGPVVDSLSRGLINYALTRTGSDQIQYQDNTSGSEVYWDNTNTTDYSLIIITPWIKLNGLQGFGRIYRAWILGNHYTDHDLKVYIGYNYDSSYGDAVDMDHPETDVQDPYQLKIGIPRQKVESIRFKLEFTLDDAVGTPDILVAVNGLMLEYGVDRRGMRVKNIHSS